MVNSQIGPQDGPSVHNISSNIFNITGDNKVISEGTVSISSNNNSDAIIFQEATINGKTETKFVKMTNGNITTKMTPDDIDTLNKLNL